MIEKIKEIRVQLDGLTQLTENLKPFETLSKEQLMLLAVNKFQRSNQTIEAVKALQLSKMWLGKVLKELGTTPKTLRKGEYVRMKGDKQWEKVESIEHNNHGIKSDPENYCMINGLFWCYDDIEVINNPYPESKNPNNEIIEPTADVTSNKISFPKPVPGDRDYTHVEKVKWLRAEIEKVENQTKETYSALFDDENLIYSTWLFPSMTKSIEYTIEAGMWLGMELGRIRDNEKNN